MSARTVSVAIASASLERGMTPMLNDERLQREVGALADLSREELAARWESAYSCPPPKGVRRDLLIRSAAWHLQAKRLGGLSAETKRKLKAAVRLIEAKLGASALPSTIDREAASGPVSMPPVNSVERQAPSPGARLIRVWNDRTHVVDVTETGYVFDGKTYRSLSAIAKRITGAHWSGPRFFGL